MIIRPAKDRRIKDEQFKRFLCETFGKEFDTDEVYFIDCHERGIRSLAGIELFTKLQALNCNNNQIEYLDLSKNPLYELDCENNPIVQYKIPRYVEPRYNCFVGCRWPKYNGLGVNYDDIRNDKINKENYFYLSFSQKIKLKYKRYKQRKRVCSDCIHSFEEVVEPYQTYPEAQLPDSKALLYSDARYYCSVENEEIADYWNKKKCHNNRFSSDSRVIWKYINTLLAAYKGKQMDDSVLSDDDILGFGIIQDLEGITKLKDWRRWHIVKDNYPWKRIDLRFTERNKYQHQPCYKCGSTDYIWAYYRSTGWQMRENKQIAICPHCKRQIYAVQQWG